MALYASCQTIGKIDLLTMTQGMIVMKHIHLLLVVLKLLFFLRYRGLNPEAFYLCATPPALIFILYFETGSHEVVEGLTKQRERETGREREQDRERERELRLAVNPDPPVSTSQSTGITSVRHRARLEISCSNTAISS